MTIFQLSIPYRCNPLLPNLPMHCIVLQTFHWTQLVPPFIKVPFQNHV